MILRIDATCTPGDAGARTTLSRVTTEVNRGIAHLVVSSYSQGEPTIAGYPNIAHMNCNCRAYNSNNFLTIAIAVHNRKNAEKRRKSHIIEKVQKSMNQTYVIFYVSLIRGRERNFSR